ncbi:hypothetical protein BLA6863_03269 [Burkholderia lata]|uniref:Uncharacterized protein n=2 Tax=Burkholderia lata (strain ATCC 17760 / DSM 23089 / LMG 22485 / NCIMB 9086 / R18194 / 383) TaxID=482957 RepID=A0A6P2LEU0_BURL3|nr:hypothetical protein BLA6863_03269 [Burkholderia lata]
MAMPKKIPAAERVLAVMIPGQVECPSVLAKRFSTSAAILRPVLEQLADDGALSRVRQPYVKHPNYILAGTEKRVELREKYVGTPAAPRTYFVMTGDLDSYAADIRRHADLCMMVRR